jgi:DNA-binding response OmpR family regulator
MMPGLTTEEILELMKKKKSRPKIILLTVVRFMQKRLDKLLEMDNMIDYIKKPFDINAFLDSVKKHI